MATIINNPGESSGSAGWVVAILLIAVLAFGGFYLFKNGMGDNGGGGTDINVTLPSPVDVMPSGGAPKQ